MPTVGITVARRTTGRMGFGDHAELEAGMMPFYVGAGSPLEQPAGRTQWNVLVHRPLIAIHGTLTISLSLLLDSFHYCVIQLSDEKTDHEESIAANLRGTETLSHLRLIP